MKYFQLLSFLEEKEDKTINSSILKSETYAINDYKNRFPKIV
jgi:hypothetical protein